MTYRTNRVRGFTLVELLIVVVIIGILATIAIPKFSAFREKSYVASVVLDLKNFASQPMVLLSCTSESFTVTPINPPNLVFFLMSVFIPSSDSSWAKLKLAKRMNVRNVIVFFIAIGSKSLEYIFY